MAYGRNADDGTCTDGLTWCFAADMSVGENIAMKQASAVDTVEFRVLGSLDVEVNGVATVVGGRRQRRLLALLLLEADRVVSADALVERMWDDDERPDHALDSVRTYVSRLRRAFTAAGLDGSEVLRTEPPGYRLAVDGNGIDAVRFERLVRSGRQMVEAGDLAGALAALDEALRLWRGRPYAEFEDRWWAEAEVGRLCELHTVALEERLVRRSISARTPRRSVSSADSWLSSRCAPVPSSS